MNHRILKIYNNGLFLSLTIINHRKVLPLFNFEVFQLSGTFPKNLCQIFLQIVGNTVWICPCSCYALTLPKTHFNPFVEVLEKTIGHLKTFNPFEPWILNLKTIFDLPIWLQNLFNSMYFFNLGCFWTELSTQMEIFASGLTNFSPILVEINFSTVWIEVHPARSSNSK